MIKVNLLIGDKSTIYQKSQAGTGEGRHHESPFFELLKDRVEFNPVPLYSLKLPLPPRLSHIAHYFLHPFFLRRKIDRTAITHIMFGEESSLLRFFKPSRKVVVTCLDLIPITYPAGLGRLNRFIQKWCLKGLKKADHVIANSQFTKNEIHRHLKISLNKISVIYPPISKIFKPVDKIPSTFFDKYGLSPEKEYLLYVGALDLPRKNVLTLITAFKKIAPAQANLELILVGHSYRKERLEKIRESLGRFAPKIHIFQNAGDQDLLYFYNLTKLFVFPSLYEGFGLPPAEAMATGTPVIVSNSASLPEVVEDAGIQVDCHDPKLLSDKISHTLKDHDLLDKLREKGLLQAKKFNWDDHAKKTYEVYKKIYGKELFSGERQMFYSTTGRKDRSP